MEVEAELGKITSDVVVDRKQGLIHKRVGQLPDLVRSLNQVPEEVDYQRLVGGSIALLKDPRWGLRGMIPDCSLRIEKDEKMMSGLACWVDMELIEGRLMSQMTEIPEEVSAQLAQFLRGCVQMAKTTKEEQGRMIFPDLLGGVERPAKRFENFLIEDGTGKLFFIDVYPLVDFSKHRLGDILKKKRYQQALTQACQAIGQPEVVVAVEELKTVF